MIVSLWRRVEAGTGSPRPLVEDVNRFVKVASWRACPLDRVSKLYRSPTELGAVSTVDTPLLPHKRRASHALVQILLACRTQPARNRNSEYVLHPLAVNVHANARECVRFQGQGRFKSRSPESRGLRSGER